MACWGRDKSMIYLDAAATSFLKPTCVAQAVVDAMHTVGPRAGEPIP